MNTAILIVSSASLVCSAGTLFIMAKMAHELKLAKDEVDELKIKLNRNAKVMKTALGKMAI